MPEIIKTFPPSHRKVLLALSIFRFLTVKQFLALEISISEHSLRKNTLVPLKSKRKYPFVKSKKLGSFFPEVFYLTKHGAKILADIYGKPIERVPYPKGGVQFGTLYARHRFAQIDFHISLRKWAINQDDTHVLFADMDFEEANSSIGRSSIERSRVVIPDSEQIIIPDGNFGIEINGTTKIFILEVHRATETTRVSLQVQRYMEVLRSGAVGIKYNLPISPFICSVHMKPNVLRGVKKHLLNLPDFQAFKPGFLFNTIDQLQDDFSAGWTFVDDRPANPFPKLSLPNNTPLIV